MNINMLPEVVVVQPKTSLTGSFIRMLPIGLLYASSKVVKEGFPVHVFDARMSSRSWENAFSRLINERTIVVGITVMSGISITESINISRYVKNKWPHISIVWGGPHPTFSPDDIFQESSVDFVIRGYGSEPFYRLVLYLAGSEKRLPLDQINGLSWRDQTDKDIFNNNKVSNSFEFLYYKDIPYHLITKFADYMHIDGERVFPMYSVMGCTYKCTFCSSPAQYAKIKKRWNPYPICEIVDHIKMAMEKFGATFIYFIDDDSFVDLKHVENIIDEINRSGLQIKLGFRGARVNEVARMSDEFLEKLANAGTDTMHIGVESGSDRILKLIRKNTTIDQIIEMNMKLSRHKTIKVFYNFIVGFPTETLEETKMTRDLILRLVKDNPSCCIIPLNKPRPLPGTELYNLAVSYGYKGPETLQEWGKYDVESSDYNPVWLSGEHDRFIRMMFLCMYFIDDKIFKLVGKGNGYRFRLLMLLAWLYKPVALFRFKKGFSKILIEDKFYNILNKII